MVADSGTGLLVVGVMALVLRAPSGSFGSASVCPGASTLKQGNIVPRCPAGRKRVIPRAAKIEIQEMGRIGTPEFEALKAGKFTTSYEVFKKYKEKFQPVTKKPEVPVILDFEKPLFALENKIKDVRRHSTALAPLLFQGCHREAFGDSVSLPAALDRRWCERARCLHVHNIGTLRRHVHAMLPVLTLRLGQDS